MCTILRMHLKSENLKLEAEQREAVPSKHVDYKGDGTDIPIVQGSRGFRYML